MTIVYKIVLVVCELIIITESITWIKEMIKNDVIHNTDKWYSYLQSTIEDGVKLAKGAPQKVAVVLTFMLMSLIYTIPYYNVAENSSLTAIKVICYIVLVSVYIMNIRNILIVCKVMHKKLSRISLIVSTIQIVISSITNLALVFGIMYYMIKG